MNRIQQSRTLMPLIFSLFLGFGCEPLEDSIVGSPSDTEISSMAFVLDTTYISGSSLWAKGRVQNSGRSSTYPPWYVEAQFYTDASFSTKLGGNSTSIPVPLSPGQATFWTITISSSNVDVRNYPNFKVGNLRAIYKN